MSLILPSAPPGYDASNEQQTRTLLERNVADLLRNLQLIRVSQGSLALGETTLTLVNGANNNLATGYTTYARIAGPSGAFSITGLEGGEIGRARVITNTTSQVMTIAHQSASSTAANRIITDAAADITVGLNGFVTLVYDATATRWKVWDRTGGITDGDKGDITVSGSGNTWTIDNNAVSDAKLRDSAALSVIGRSANSTGDPADIAAANDGEVLRRSGTTLGFGTVATAGITNDAVTYAKIQNISAQYRLLGRSSSGAGDTEEITSSAFAFGLLDDADAATARITLGVRDVLTANRTYYLRTDGSDSNTGLVDSAGGAWLTLTHALDFIGSLDISIYNCTLTIGAGTWSEQGKLKSPLGSGNVVISGAGATTIIDPPAGVNHCCWGEFGGRFIVSNIRLTKTTATTGHAIFAQNGTIIQVNSGVEYGVVTGRQNFANQNGKIILAADYTINGNAQMHWSTASGGLIQCLSRTITLTGTPAYSSQFANASDIGLIQATGNTFSGAATGTRYLSELNSVIRTAGLTLPGSVAGSTATGGQYT